MYIRIHVWSVIFFKELYLICLKENKHLYKLSALKTLRNIETNPNAFQVCVIWNDFW